MTKKKLTIGIAAAVVIGIIAIGLSGGAPTTSNASLDQLDESITTTSILQDADAYKGKVVKVTGRIFQTNIDTGNSGTAFQIWTDPENSEGNIIVYAETTSEAVDENKYVEIIGEVRGKFSGDNAFGANLSAPSMTALQVKEIDRNVAVAPVIKTIEGKAQTKGGVTITVDRIDFAEKETRVVLTVKNVSAGTINFYGFNGKLVQNDSQIKEKTLFDTGSNYDIPSDILSGTTENGILFFEKANPDVPLKLHLEATAADYSTLNFDFAF